MAECVARRERNGVPTATVLTASTISLVDQTRNPAAQGTAALSADRRGRARPGVTGGACEIRAVELQPHAPERTPPVPTPGDCAG